MSAVEAPRDLQWAALPTVLNRGLDAGSTSVCADVNPGPTGARGHLNSGVAQSLTVPNRSK